MRNLYILHVTNTSGRHEKLVRVQFSQKHRCNADQLLLELDQSILYQLGLDMESALLSLNKDGCVKVTVCNYSVSAQCLSKGQILGRLYFQYTILLWTC